MFAEDIKYEIDHMEELEDQYYADLYQDFALYEVVANKVATDNRAKELAIALSLAAKIMASKSGPIYVGPDKINKALEIIKGLNKDVSTCDKWILNIRDIMKVPGGFVFKNINTNLITYYSIIDGVMRVHDGSRCHRVRSLNGLRLRFNIRPCGEYEKSVDMPVAKLLAVVDELSCGLVRSRYSDVAANHKDNSGSCGLKETLTTDNMELVTPAENSRHGQTWNRVKARSGLSLRFSALNWKFIRDEALINECSDDKEYTEKLHSLLEDYEATQDHGYWVIR